MLIPVDIETTGLDFNRDKILGIGVGTQYYHDLRARFEWPDNGIYHNGKFDVKFLQRHKPGIDWLLTLQFDTMLAASVLIERPKSLSLDACSAFYLGLPSHKGDVDRKNMSAMDPEIVAHYCKQDLNVTAQLADVLRKKLLEEGSLQFFEEKIMPSARLLADVEYRGMALDVAATEQRRIETVLKLQGLENKLAEKFGKVNYKSPKQVINAIKTNLGITPQAYNFRLRKVQDSTNEEALRKHLPNPWIELLLEHREQTKLLGYIEGWLELQFNGRIHPTYNLSSTRTGRLSCSEPNLQQVPRDKSIRSLFVPTPGKVYVIADFAQIEPRVAAHYSQDENLMKVFTDGLDFYGSIANQVLGVDCHPNKVKEQHPKLRQVAKVIGLAILYGIGAAKLRNMIKNDAGITYSLSDCEAIKSDYFKAYPGLLELRKYVERVVTKRGYLNNHMGRKVFVEREKVFGTGVNYLVQSTASDICLFSQLKVKGADLVALVHDEVIYEVEPANAPAFAENMKQIMENAGLSVPLKVEYSIGNSWGDKA